MVNVNWNDYSERAVSQTETVEDKVSDFSLSESDSFHISDIDVDFDDKNTKKKKKTVAKKPKTINKDSESENKGKKKSVKTVGKTAVTKKTAAGDKKSKKAAAKPAQEKKKTVVKSDSEDSDLRIDDVSDDEDAKKKPEKRKAVSSLESDSEDDIIFRNSSVNGTFSCCKNINNTFGLPRIKMVQVTDFLTHTNTKKNNNLCLLWFCGTQMCLVLERTEIGWIFFFLI